MSALLAYIYDAAIVDADGKAFCTTNANWWASQFRRGRIFTASPTAAFAQQLRLVYRPAAVYDVSYPLQLERSSLSAPSASASPPSFCGTNSRPGCMHAAVFFDRIHLRFVAARGR